MSRNVLQINYTFTAVPGDKSENLVAQRLKPTPSLLHIETKKLNTEITDPTVGTETDRGAGEMRPNYSTGELRGPLRIPHEMA